MASEFAWNAAKAMCDQWGDAPDDDDANAVDAKLQEVREVLLSTARHRDADKLPCWCVVMMRTMPHMEHCQRARDLMEKLKP